MARKAVVFIVFCSVSIVVGFFAYRAIIIQQPALQTPSASANVIITSTGENITEEEWIFRLRSHGGVLTSVLQSPLGWLKVMKDNPDESNSDWKQLLQQQQPQQQKQEEKYARNQINQDYKAIKETKKIQSSANISSVVDLSNIKRPTFSINTLGFWNESIIGSLHSINISLLPFEQILSNCSVPKTVKEKGQLWALSNDSFMDRVTFFNQVLTFFRSCLLEARGYRPWRALNTEIHSLWANTDDFLFRLKNYSDIILTVFLSWNNYEKINLSNWSSQTDVSNLLLQQYYEWAGTEPLCRWIRTEGFTKAHWDAVYGKHCNTNISNTITPQSLEVVYLYARPINKNHYWPNDGLSYPASYYRDVPRQIFYVNIAQDAVISPAGDIWTDRLKLIPYACSQEIDPRPPMFHQALPIFSEVFIVTQFWGSAYFHKMIEGIPRIAPYLTFLKANPGIKIHMPDQNAQTETIFSILGLNKERIVTGEIRAKIAYLPQATPCGFAIAPAIQILAQTYRTYIVQKYPNITHNSIVMVKRTQGRRFKHHDLILAAIAALAAEFHLEFVLYDDMQLPNFEKTMTIFYAARIIIGPHGAGLSNMIFSQPGTYVIEGVCNPPHVNMCFQHTAHVLGHHYHGIPSSEGCEDYIDVQPSVVKDVLKTYLQILFRS